MAPYSISLVDDEKVILETLSRDLRKEGYKVFAAKSGEEALETFEKNACDLVIADLVMEGMDGLQFLKKAKKMNPEACLMILTGYGTLDTCIDALRFGVYDYILKPCQRLEFLQKVAHCFEVRELKRKIKIHEKFLAVCSWCRKIRDDTGTEFGEGVWIDWDSYLAKRAGVEMTHGVCSKCARKVMRDIAKIKKQDHEKK